jgi:ATP-binding cassette subfamily F protein 3
MRLLAGTLAPSGGQLVTAPDYRPGFFAQLELEHLDPAASSIEELARRAGPEVAAWTEQAKRTHLGRFGFRGDRVFEPVARFSGGEKARLALAILVARRPNVLLLDEPTNHLDFDMRRALLLALQEYAGALVVVSHDRALLRGACDAFLVVGDGTVAPFDGDLEDYAGWLAARAQMGASAAQVGAPAGLSRREERRQEAQARNRLTALRAELQAAEKSLAQLVAERASIEEDLANPDFYVERPASEQRMTTRRHAAVISEIDVVETRWLELSDELDARRKEKGGP